MNFGKLPCTLLLETVRRVLLSEISNVSIDVKIISVLSCINVISDLEIQRIDTFSKILVLENENGSIQRKIICHCKLISKLIFCYYLIVVFLLHISQKEDLRDYHWMRFITA